MSDQDPNLDVGDGSSSNGGDESEFYVEPSQPKNNQVLVLFGLMIVGAVALYFVYFKNTPSAANASAEAVTADQTINDFLNNGDGSLQKMEEMRRNTEKVVERFMNYPANTQVPLKDLPANPFRMLADAPRSAEDEGALAAQQREEARRLAIKEVEALNLQSILYGTKKSCMINNAMYGEGQQIDNFVVEKISPATVIVRKDAFRFELKMRRPDGGPAAKF